MCPFEVPRGYELSVRMMEHGKLGHRAVYAAEEGSEGLKPIGL